VFDFLEDMSCLVIGGLILLVLILLVVCVIGGIGVYTVAT
jgi:hypothetical protein